MRTFKQQRSKAFQRAVDQARYGSKLCGCLMYVHEPTPGIFMTIENPQCLGSNATHFVDPEGQLREYREPEQSHESLETEEVANTTA